MASTVPLLQNWAPGPANELHDAAYDGSTEQTLALLSRGSIDINEGDPAGWTPLMYGASRGFSRIVEILLNVGADTSVRMESGCTALHLASQDGRLAVVTLLVQAGADLDAINCQGLTQLHLAAGLGNS